MRQGTWVGTWALSLALLVLAGCGGGDSGGSDEEGDGGGTTSVEELQSIVEQYNADGAIGTNCEWEESADSAYLDPVGDSIPASAVHEYACDGTIAPTIIVYGSEEDAGEYDVPGSFRSGPLVMEPPSLATLGEDERAAFLDFVQQECDCGEVIAE